MAERHFSCPCIIGYGSSPSRCGPSLSLDTDGRSRDIPASDAILLRVMCSWTPAGTAMPRMTALHMLRSTITTVSAPASSSFRGSLPHPTQPLCTLRVRRYRRLTQHSLPGDLLGLTWAGLAPADRASFAWRLRLFDHLVGDRNQIGRYVEAYRPRGLEVDDELILGRKLDRQVARLGAAQNAIHVGWHAPIHIGKACSVLEQTAFLCEILVVNRRHVVADRVPYHRAAMSEHEIIGQRDETCFLLPERCDDPLYVAIVPHFGDKRRYSQRARGGLERAQIIQTATGCRI